jgi:Fur family transcriptional regulator, ferric uptake regulator
MASTEKIIEALHQRGVRLTMQRRLVIEALCERGDHMAVLDVQHYLQQHGTELNETTVYRILQSLKDLGIVSQTDLGQSGLVYQVIEETPHHHLICLFCGKIINIDNDYLEPLNERLRREYGFEARMDHMAIFGCCQECQSQDTPPK